MGLLTVQFGRPCAKEGCEVMDRKKLERKAKSYASGVFKVFRSRLTRIKLAKKSTLDYLEGVTMAAFFNGFDAGVVWQKQAKSPKA